MDKLTGFTKTLIFLLLILISASSYIYLGWHKITLIISSCSLGLIIAILIYQYIRKKNRSKLYRKLTHLNERKIAKIINVKFYEGLMAIQVLVKGVDQNYVSGIVLQSPNDAQRTVYLEGAIVDVFSNPQNPLDVYFADNLGGPSTGSRFDWGSAVIWVISLSGLWIPFLFWIFEEPDWQFQDNKMIQSNNQQNQIWELYFDSPDKLYILIYDPKTNKRIKKIKEKREKDFEGIGMFEVDQQMQNAVIIGYGDNPVFDVYDVATFRKLSDIKVFEERNDILKDGIASISEKTFRRSILKEKIIEIITNNGNRYYYNLQQNRFYKTEDEVDNYYHQADSANMGLYLNTFGLSYINDSPVENHQLYAIESSSRKDINKLLDFAGESILEIGYFESGNYYNSKYLKLVPLLPENFFINGKILYFDFELILLIYQTSANINAEVYISAFDKSGKKLFNIMQSEFPNFEDMNEQQENFISNYYYYDVQRAGGEIVVYFKKYGAICMNLKSGEQKWKFEPK